MFTYSNSIIRSKSKINDTKYDYYYYYEEILVFHILLILLGEQSLDN